MKGQTRNCFLAAGIFLGAFALWTALLCLIDRQPIGPQGSTVGFAALNQSVRELIGVNMALYTLTDWLSLVPVGLVAGFGILGLAQWIGRKNLRKVDFSLLLLGGFFLAVLAAYLLFEIIEVNYRPVLLDGVLEASYPSSTTMLALCILPTAARELNLRIRCKPLRAFLTLGITAVLLLMVVGRVLSGVHWITDIIGGCLLSGGLLMAYHAAAGWEKQHNAPGETFSSWNERDG